MTREISDKCLQQQPQQKYKCIFSVNVYIDLVSLLKPSDVKIIQLQTLNLCLTMRHNGWVNKRNRRSNLISRS